MTTTEETDMAIEETRRMVKALEGGELLETPEDEVSMDAVDTTGWIHAGVPEDGGYGFFLAIGRPIPYVAQADYGGEMLVPPDTSIGQDETLYTFSPYGGGAYGCNFGFVAKKPPVPLSSHDDLLIEVEQVKDVHLRYGGEPRKPRQLPYEISHLEGIFGTKSDIMIEDPIRDGLREWAGRPHAYELIPAIGLWLIVSLAND